MRATYLIILLALLAAFFAHSVKKAQAELRAASADLATPTRIDDSDDPADEVATTD